MPKCTHVGIQLIIVVHRLAFMKVLHVFVTLIFRHFENLLSGREIIRLEEPLSQCDQIKIAKFL